MEKNNDGKIINLFGKNNASQNDAETRYFAGFEYILLDKDSNGNPFLEQNLLDYASTCHYIVRVMRKKNEKVCLYNYDIPSDKLYEFLGRFYNNELKGVIIEIDKYLPDDLA